jgi:UPF0716 protein FxsA
MFFFLVVPITEIYLLIKVGSYVGVLPTVALVVLTAFIGAFLLRNQGLQTYLRFNQSLSEGRLPANELLEGVVLLVGGGLLLTPGFITDLIGFFCLLPITRRPIVTFIVNRFNPLAGVNMSNMRDSPFSGMSSSVSPSKPSGNVYEGEVVRHTDE